MEEGLDIDGIMTGLGFSKERDVSGCFFGEGYGKKIVVCNSNCIGCEYHMSFGIRKTHGNQYNSVGVLYKPLSHDREMHFDKDMNLSDKPRSRIFILNTERGDIENAVYDCALTFAQVMNAMDFRQISGTDFIDLSNSSRESMMSDFDREVYIKVYAPFNPRDIPSGG